MAPRSDFRNGVRKITPIIPPAATVAIAAGVAAPVAGLSPLEALVMSIAIYFPSVMLTALELLRSQLPEVVVVFTSLIVGVRVVILSLSIAPYFKRFSTGWKWLLAYFLWTPVYALTVERFSAEPASDVRAFYLGMAVPLWITVQLAVVVGAVFSARVPSGLELDFIIPLAFIALLMNFITDQAAKITALVSGVLAVLGSGIPLGLGVVVATIGGTVAGTVVSRSRREE